MNDWRDRHTIDAGIAALAVRRARFTGRARMYPSFEAEDRAREWRTRAWETLTLVAVLGALAAAMWGIGG
jgi:hypothetical protein